MKKTFLAKICAGFSAGILAVSLAVSAVAFSSPVTAKAQGEVLTGLTAMEITEQMGKGYNIGNTLDATGGSMDRIEEHERSWGNPVINKELMHGLKEAGFSSVRVPITWMKHIDKKDNYKISDAFLARVKEVVDMAYDEELFVIINVHHESWVNRSDFDASYTEIGVELTAVWEQIADYFADYDQHLIFEGMNEPRAQGESYEWIGNEACYEGIAYLDQLFVETVRTNGKGHNNERMLMIPGYAASSDPQVLKSIVIPTVNGAQATNVAVSVHCYSPYNFCLSDAQVTFDPGNGADTADITNLLSNLKYMFLDKGIPVVIGECGCTNSGDNNNARLAWFKYFGEITAKYGIPAIVWDNGASGNSGGECHKYFNRKTGESLHQDLLDAFIGVPEVLGDTYLDFEAVRDAGGTTFIVPSEVGFTSNTLTTKMNVNHTENAEMGYALCVKSTEDDFTASMNISKYAEIPVMISAWIRSDGDDTVVVGINNGSATEMAKVETSKEWTQVSFMATPEAGKKTYLYFTGNEKTFYIDDLEIVMNGSIADGSVDAPAAGDTVAGGADGAVTTDGEAETKGVSPVAIILIACGVVAAVAIVVIIVGSKKKQK